MHTNLERLARRMTATERMTLLVGALVMVAMLSAITLDRLLAQQATPAIVTLAPASTAGNLAVDAAYAPNPSR